MSLDSALTYADLADGCQLVPQLLLCPHVGFFGWIDHQCPSYVWNDVRALRRCEVSLYLWSVLRRIRLLPRHTR